MQDLPAGTVTFLFTDIEGSTALLKQLGRDRYDEVLADHGRLLRAAIAAHDGRVVDTQGDSFFAAFQTAGRRRGRRGRRPARAGGTRVGRRDRGQGADGPAHGRAEGRRGALRRDRRPSRGSHRCRRTRGPGAAVLDDEGARRGRPPAWRHDPRPRRAAPEGHRPAAAPLPARHRGAPDRFRAAEDARRRAPPQAAAGCTRGRR